MNASISAAAALSLLVAVPAPQSRPAGKLQSRRVFVTVRDRSGQAVTDLKTGDFEVTENDVKREVTKAGLAESPMRIVLLVDTSEGTTPAVNHIRTALSAFLDALPPEHEVTLVSTGRQVRVRVPPTTDRKKLKDAANGIFSEGGATPLMDALLEMDDRFLRKAEDRWPVFVIITGDGGESSAGANEKKFNDWLRALPARGISAHGVSLKLKGGGTPEMIAQHVSQTAGGQYDFINTSNSLPGKMKGIAEQLAQDFERGRTKYEITFLTDAADRPVSIGVARQGVFLEMSAGRLR